MKPAGDRPSFVEVLEEHECHTSCWVGKEDDVCLGCDFPYVSADMDGVTIDGTAPLPLFYAIGEWLRDRPKLKDHRVYSRG